jgi:hypothetical protein
MLQLRFRGWFQCRLATDPDPYDEPRGVSGYVRAYAGEPDLDRLISFQRPAFARTYGPPIGVQVDQVSLDGEVVRDHPLVGAAVDLLGRPVFEGRNGVIADDGLEPIYPFRLQVRKDDFVLEREIVPTNPDFPYEGFLAHGVERAAEEIALATGIQSLGPVWKQRLERLRQDEPQANEPERTGIAERIRFLSREVEQGSEDRGTARFFIARMRYDYPLPSDVRLEDPRGWLPPVELNTAWQARFWLGGWDADVLCGYCLGTLVVPPPGQALPLELKRPRRP